MFCFFCFCFCWVFSGFLLLFVCVFCWDFLGGVFLCGLSALGDKKYQNETRNRWVFTLNNEVDKNNYLERTKKQKEKGNKFLFNNTFRDCDSDCVELDILFSITEKIKVETQYSNVSFSCFFVLFCILFSFFLIVLCFSVIVVVCSCVCVCVLCVCVCVCVLMS